MSFSTADILDLIDEVVGGGDVSLRQFRGRDGHLDGVSVFHRGDGAARARRQLEASDLVHLEAEAALAMRRYSAEVEAGRRPVGRVVRPVRAPNSPRRQRVLRPRPPKLTREQLSMAKAVGLVVMLRGMGVRSTDIHRTLARETPFALLAVMRQMPVAA